MKFMSEEGAVLTCQVMECSYNESEECHASEIQVGGNHPTCDTFTTSGMVEKSRSEGDVSACDMSQCHFNSHNDCEANGITVAMHENHADCYTFRPEMNA